MAGVEPESKQEEESSETMIRLFNDFYKALEHGRLEEFTEAIASLQPFLESPGTKVTEVLRNEENPFKDTNLIILCCKFGRLNILDYLLNNGRNFIDSLYNGTVANHISPSDEDGQNHDAFYYAIRSNNVEIVQLLMTKWLQFFDDFVYRKESLLYNAYEQLKLRNVELTEGMEFFVESEIVACHFTSNSDDVHSRDIRTDFVKRMDWLLTNINSLKTVKEESAVLLLVQCVAQNIHLLKYQLKSTYEMIPWEELEFCVISYVISSVYTQEKSILPLVAITKETLVKQLWIFSQILKNLSFQCLLGPNAFPNMTREEIVSKIKKNSPDFIELYGIYEKVRDIYSLEKLEKYLKLSLSVNHEEKQGQLAIVRVLDVLSDYLRNSLDNYKLSDTTSRVILSALPRGTRRIVFDLRNSGSHSHSLEKRLEIEEKSPEFFRNVQDELKLPSYVVSRILNNEKLRMAVDCLETINKSNERRQVRTLNPLIKRVEQSIDDKNFDVFEDEKIKRLIRELKAAILVAGMSDQELQLFDDVMHSLTTNCQAHVPLSLIVDKASTESRSRPPIDNFKSFARKMLVLDLPLVKSAAMVALRDLSPTKYIEKMSAVLEFVKDIDKIINRKANLFNFLKLDVDKMKMLLFEISVAATMKVEDVLCRDMSQDIRDPNESTKQFLSEAERDGYLKSQLTVLENLLKNEEKSSIFLKENKTLRLATELLLLDILSISGHPKCEVEKIVLHIEKQTPVLARKCLKNYLAYGSALFDIFPTDPATAIQSNAFLFLNYDFSNNVRKIEKVFCDDVSEAKENFEVNMNVVTNQDQLFFALHKGDIEKSLALMKSAADVFCQSIWHESILHFAALKPIVDNPLAKFILEQNVKTDSVDIKGRTALHVAAEYGNVTFIEHFVAKVSNLDLEQKDKEGNTCLHYAAKNWEHETIELLIKLGAAPSPMDNNSRTPLFSAIEDRVVPIVEILLENGANISGLEAIGRLNPLHVAAEYNYGDIINVLIKKGAHVNIADDLNRTPLIVAALNNCLEAAEVLIKAGANVNAYSSHFTALHFAAIEGHKEMAALLLRNGADANTRNLDQPIHFAAKNGNLDVVKLLIDHKANLKDQNSEGLTPLHLAAQCGHVKVIQALRRAGVGIERTDNHGSTALHLSASNGHLEATKLLIEKGAKLDATNGSECTALHLAAEGGFDEVGEMLVRRGAEVNVARKVDGCTPLHIAAKKKANSLVDLLLQRGANPEAKNNSDMTPLSVASGIGNIVAVTLLSTAKCNVNVRDSHGLTPLHSASSAGSCEIAELLLKNGADLNSTCQEGLTPLYYAVAHEHFDLVQLLVGKGADVNLGETTPVVKAVENNSKDVLEYLVKQGADVSKDDLLFKTVCSGVSDCMVVLLKNGCLADSRSSGDQTALHLASAMGFRNIVSDLLLYGANVDSLDHDKMTPLHYAVKANNPEVVEVLLSGDANIGSKTRNGHTALHLAAEFGDRRIIELLLVKGADPLEEDENKETPLSQSIRSCDVERVKAMCQSQKVDQFVRFWNRMTPFQLSAAYSLDIVKYFVTSGSVPTLVDVDIKPIHMACIAGKQDIVEYFLDSGISVNETCEEKLTLLHYAALHDHLHLVEYLIAKGANVHAEDSSKNTPLVLARKNGAIVKILLENGAFFNAKNPPDDAANTYFDAVDLLLAVKDDDVSTVKEYIKMGTCLNAVSNSGSGSPLHFASFEGYYEIVRLLLEHNANVNVLTTEGSTPLHYAAQFSHKNIALELLIHGAVYNVIRCDSHTPLSLASENTVLELLSFIVMCFDLVEKGDVNVKSIIQNEGTQNGIHLEALIKTRNRNNQDIFQVAGSFSFPYQNELYELCHASYIKTNLERLQSRDFNEASLEKMRAEFKKKQEWFAGKNTPFSQNFCQEINNLLLELDKCKNALKPAKQETLEAPPEKQTEVIAAALKGDLDSLKELLEKKCNVNETDGDEITALHVAVDRGDKKCVKLLLQYGADITHISKKGDTALHSAVENQSASIVKMLLEFALNNEMLDVINKPNSSGNTALHVAAKNDDLAIVKTLMTFGAIYEIRNGEGETPKDFSSNVKVVRFFNVLNDMFADARTGNFRLVTVMKSMKNEDICAVAGAKNIGGRTIVQVASSLKHKSIPSTLMKIVQTASIE